MDFYNFEKYNDLFCFEKLNGDYQPLLKTYKDSYQTSMNIFLKEYEENTELRFIENQLYFCNKEINIQKSIITSLEKLDHETFYYVRNRISERHCVYTKNIGDPFENETQIIFENSKNDVPDELKAPTIINFTNDDDNDDEVLDMYATSKNFIKFISNRITSLCLINEFLGERKQELQKESIITLEINSIENKKSEFSVLEWATIFYYADSCKYFNQKNKTEKQAFFIEEHKITTSKNSFKNKVITAKNTINKTQTYSIDKLNCILPFVKEKYNKGVTLIENDKVYLDENNKKEDDY